jgi:hypothetical protein
MGKLVEIRFNSTYDLKTNILNGEQLKLLQTY